MNVYPLHTCANPCKPDSGKKGNTTQQDLGGVLRERENIASEDEEANPLFSSAKLSHSGQIYITDLPVFV